MGFNHRWSSACGCSCPFGPSRLRISETQSWFLRRNLIFSFGGFGVFLRLWPLLGDGGRPRSLRHCLFRLEDGVFIGPLPPLILWFWWLSLLSIIKFQPLNHAALDLNLRDVQGCAFGFAMSSVVASLALPQVIVSCSFGIDALDSSLGVGSLAGLLMFRWGCFLVIGFLLIALRTRGASTIVSVCRLLERELLHLVQFVRSLLRDSSWKIPQITPALLMGMGDRELWGIGL